MHSRNELHVKLYQISGPRHVILRTQKMLAYELGMSQFTLNRIMGEMVSDRRIKIIGKGRSATKRYVVYDPRVWCSERHDYTGAEFARGILEPSESPRVKKEASEEGAVDEDAGKGSDMEPDDHGEVEDVLSSLPTGDSGT